MKRRKHSRTRKAIKLIKTPSFRIRTTKNARLPTPQRRGPPSHYKFESIKAGCSRIYFTVAPRKVSACMRAYATNHPDQGKWAFRTRSKTSCEVWHLPNHSPTKKTCRPKR